MYILFMKFVLTKLFTSSKNICTFYKQRKKSSLHSKKTKRRSVTQLLKYYTQPT